MKNIVVPAIQICKNGNRRYACKVCRVGITDDIDFKKIPNFCHNCGTQFKELPAPIQWLLEKRL